MKKVFAYVLLLALPKTSFCQKTNDSVPDFKTHYLVKRKIKKRSVVLLEVALHCIGIGFLIWRTTKFLLRMMLLPSSYGRMWSFNIGSIPLFYCIRKNQRKATKHNHL
jgi:hypothetical protein